MTSSFRNRLALLSALLSGLALLVFCLCTWSLIRAQQLNKLDREIQSHAEREVSRVRDAQGWQRTLQDMANSLDLGEPGADPLCLGQLASKLDRQPELADSPTT